MEAPEYPAALGLWDAGPGVGHGELGCQRVTVVQREADVDPAPAGV